MSLRDALAFAGLVREDAALAAEVSALGAAATLVELVAIGARRSLVFTEDELRSAHRHDWAMRRVRWPAAQD